MPDEPDAYDYGELVVVQHADHTGPSNLTGLLDGRARRRPWQLLRPDRGEPFPTTLTGVRGILVLGGPMGVADHDQMPWLDAEIGFMGDAVGAGVAVFGICLGHQLLAQALGGRVAPRSIPEIGFHALVRTDEGRDDTVFAGWPDGSTTLFVHDDEVSELPEGGVAMLTGSDGIAAWRAADGLGYGVQFHPETSAELFAEWCQRPDNLPRFERAGVDPGALAKEARRRERFLRAVGTSLVGRWIDAVVGRDDPTTPRRRRTP